MGRSTAGRQAQLSSLSLLSPSPPCPSPWLSPAPVPTHRVKLVDMAVESVCKCFNQALKTSDDALQLQIIQALQTGVTTQDSQVHEGSLLTAVRTVYNLYLQSKNQARPARRLRELTLSGDNVFASLGYYFARRVRGSAP